MKTVVRSSGGRAAAISAPLRRALGRGKDLLARLRDDQRGLGAVEFALIAPMLIVIYLVSLELTLGFSAAKRTTSAASVIADLISQRQSITKAELKSMEDVTKSIFAPSSPADMTLKITGITIDASNKPTIAWSWANTGAAPYVKGSPAVVSDQLLYPDTFLIHSELSVPHKLIMFLPDLSSNLKNLTLSRDYYFRQRVGEAGITCSDC